jgi:hypothetical protein
MLFTRFWMLLLAVAAGLSLAAMALARNTYEHDRADDTRAMLTSDRKLLDEFLRRDARTRVDDLAPVSSNAQLVTLMETTIRRADDTPATIGPAITARLRELNQSLGALRGEVMIAVDPRGVVVGRTGLGEGELGANLGGLPLVQSALSGNTRDDLWEIAGQAYRMAARPIISRGQYYVGAIVHGMAINDGFASTVAQLAPGASVMFFGPDGMYASFHPVPDRGARRAPAPAALVERLRFVRTSDPWRTRGVTEPLAASDHDADMGVAVFAAVPGMIGAAGGGIALARATPMMPGSIFPTSKEDLARVPSLPIGLGMLALALLGNLFLYIEFDSKRKRLSQALEGLAQEGNNHLDPLQLSGFARDLAVVANDGIEALLKREVQRSAGRLRNVNELDSLLKTPEVVLGNQAPMPPAPAMPPMAPMPPMGPPMPPPGAPPMPPMAPMAPPAPRPMPPPPNVRRAQPVQIDEDEQPTSIAQVPNALKLSPVPPAMGEGDEQAHWREVFEEFVARKKECNEPTDSLTYDKFVGTLQKHKEQLITRTGCRTVRFQVYIKDGKATLKASPVR